ncbi:30S ribosomal protein S7 [Candidatus Falkowbacteria bacterium]|nr:30S ribosomal protein S7 [Candidatus Falkowbacteria bacterium]
MRGKPAPKRRLNPDATYHNVLVAKLINYIMRDGKRSAAEKAVYGAMKLVAEKMKKDPLEVFDGALRNVTPLLEVRSRRVGGANYQIPYPVRGERRYILAFRWLIAAARARQGVPMSQKLAAELMDAYNKEGAAIKKRDDAHRMAEANKAFAHFAR